MNKSSFTEQELAFFEEGDTLADHVLAVEDFSDLDEDHEPTSGWAERALAALSLVSAR